MNLLWYLILKPIRGLDKLIGQDNNLTGQITERILLTY